MDSNSIRLLDDAEEDGSVDIDDSVEEVEQGSNPQVDQAKDANRYVYNSRVTGGAKKTCPRSKASKRRLPFELEKTKYHFNDNDAYTSLSSACIHSCFK